MEKSYQLFLHLELLSQIKNTLHFSKTKWPRDSGRIISRIYTASGIYIIPNIQIKMFSSLMQWVIWLGCPPISLQHIWRWAVVTAIYCSFKILLESKKIINLTRSPLTSLELLVLDTNLKIHIFTKRSICNYKNWNKILLNHLKNDAIDSNFVS